MSMSPITTHILDTSKGCPAANVEVFLEISSAHGWQEIGRGATNNDGRAGNLLNEKHTLETATYRLTFEIGKYFAATNVQTFYPRVQVTFSVHEKGGHYHVPLLISPFGYSTYRGS